MARRPKAPSTQEPPDRIEGIALPRETVNLAGHRAAEAALLDAYRLGRMHHAWLVSGDEGIGKATLAFRMARFVLAHSDHGSDHVRNASSLDVPADHPAAVKIAHGTHGNILHIQREWDDRGKKYRTALTVDAIRALIPFLGTTAGEGDWRIVIIDPADDMNRNAANALLKALEEPPAKTLFFVISSMPGRLLPTIRSRCRSIVCQPLSENDLMQVLQRAEPDFANRPDADLVLALAGGSARKAFEMIGEGGVSFYRALITALDQPSFANIQSVANLVADEKNGGPAKFIDLLGAYMSRRVHGVGEPLAAHRPRQLPLATWAQLWEKASRSSRDTEIYNLDVRQFVLDILETYASAARQNEQ